MYNKPVIISLGAQHSKLLAALEAQCFSSPWDEASFARAFDSKLFRAIGIEFSGTLLAYLSINCVEDEAEILNLAVHKDLRRQGLGRALLTAQLQLLKKEAFSKVLLEVRENNLAAYSLYSSEGFVVVGRRSHYYQDSGEDALLMLCTLNYSK